MHYIALQHLHSAHTCQALLLCRCWIGGLCKRLTSYLYLLSCRRFLRLCDGGGEELGLNAGLQLSGGGVRHFLLLLGCGLSSLLSAKVNREIKREKG